MIQSHFSMELLRHSMSTKWFKAKLNRNAHNIKTLTRQKKLNYRDLEILVGITQWPPSQKVYLVKSVLNYNMSFKYKCSAVLNYNFYTIILEKYTHIHSISLSICKYS